MSKITAIVSLVLFSSTTEVGQLLRLPLLISHYIDHYREEGQGICAFFHEHYVHHHGVNNDQQEDDRLPFKTTIVQQATVVYLLQNNETIKKPIIIIDEKKPTLPTLFITPDFLKDIFHPPQIV